MCCKMLCVLSVWWAAELGCSTLGGRLKKCDIILIKFLPTEADNQAVL